MLKIVGAATITFGVGWLATSQFVSRYYNFGQIKQDLIDGYSLNLVNHHGPQPAAPLVAMMTLNKEQQIDSNLSKLNLVVGFFWIPYWALFVYAQDLRIRNIHEWSQENIDLLKGVLND